MLGFGVLLFGVCVILLHATTQVNEVVICCILHDALSHICILMFLMCEAVKV